MKFKELTEPFKKPWHFVLVNVMVGFIMAIVSINDAFASPKYILVGTIWGTVIFSTQWLGHAFIQNLLAKKYSWVERPAARLILTIISIIAYSISAFILVQVLMNLAVFGEIPQWVLTVNFYTYGIPVIVAFLVSLFVAAYGFFFSWKSALKKQEELKTEMLSYKYESLRNQINPHFMFNSLNVLSDLVYDDQKLAVKFIHHFGDIYRYVLDCREKELVSLKDELAFIEKFLFLLKIRFEEKLQIEMDIPAEADDLIVPLSLQLLIENGVKHNEISTQNPLTIRLKRDGNKITVSNQIQPKQSREDSSKIGLKNLKQQFLFFHEDEIVVEDQDGIFKVEIPILKKA
ncbi:MAG: histidine kinase [Flavobacteriales bacterium]|jgi:sensor histidine kinase YesM|nr:histidine kinase [Flavobacteriales bacterium]